MKTLSISLFRRPLCAALTLAAIAKCHGIEDYDVFVNVDASGDTPHGEAVCRAVQPFLQNPRWLRRSSPTRGCNASIVACMDWGFESGSDFHVHLEDDTLPHHDFLRFMEWSARRFRDDKSVFSASGYAYSDRGGHPMNALARKWFTPWGWGTWSDRWSEARGQIDVTATLSWDCQITRIRGERSEVFPQVGRILNIGQHGGAYNNPELWEREQFNPVWMGSVAPRASLLAWSYAGEEAA